MFVQRRWTPPPREENLVFPASPLNGNSSRFVCVCVCVCNHFSLPGNCRNMWLLTLKKNRTEMCQIPGNSLKPSWVYAEKHTKNPKTIWPQRSQFLWQPPLELWEGKSGNHHIENQPGEQTSTERFQNNTSQFLFHWTSRPMSSLKVNMVLK